MNRLENLLPYLQKRKYAHDKPPSSQFYNVDQVLEDLEPFDRKHFLDQAQNTQYISYQVTKPYIGHNPYFCFSAELAPKGEQLVYTNMYTAILEKIKKMNGGHLECRGIHSNKLVPTWSMEITDKFLSNLTARKPQTRLVLKLDNVHQAIAWCKKFSQNLPGQFCSYQMTVE